MRGSTEGVVYLTAPQAHEPFMMIFDLVLRRLISIMNYSMQWVAIKTAFVSLKSSGKSRIERKCRCSKVLDSCSIEAWTQTPHLENCPATASMSKASLQ
jgi:hypothetical protein